MHQTATMAVGTRHAASAANNYNSDNCVRIIMACGRDSGDGSVGASPGGRGMPRPYIKSLILCTFSVITVRSGDALGWDFWRVLMHQTATMAVGTRHAASAANNYNSDD